MSNIVLLADIITFVGIAIGFVGSVVLARRGLSGYQEKLDNQENNRKEDLRAIRDRLSQQGQLESGDDGFNFVSKTIQTQVGDIGEITRIEQPENDGISNEIHVTTSSGERFDAVLTTIQLHNAIDRIAERERQESDDATVYMGAVYLALGFLLQAIGHLISTILS